MAQHCKITFFLSSLSAGGGERVMIDVANALAKRRHTVEIIVLTSTGAFKDDINPAIRVVELRASRFLSAIPEVRTYIHKERPKTIVATNEHTHLVLIIANILSFHKTRTVLRVGIPLSLQPKQYTRLRDKLLPFFSRILYRYADAFIAVSKGIARDIKETLSIPEEKIQVVYHPKDIGVLERRAAERPDHPWLADKTKPVIVSAGRLRIQKDFETLIRAFAKVRKQQDVRLVIFGDGSERNNLERLARELGVSENLSLAGFTKNVHANIARADVYVLSSLWEGLPGALMEAMALGVPVVATDCPYGPRELLAPDTDVSVQMTEGLEEGKHGILTPTLDSDALMSALTQLLSDINVRAKYAHIARLRAGAFAAERRIVEYEQALCGMK